MSLRLKVLTINMGEIIAITSGKGGSGKTSMAVNLSCGIASLNKKVLVIDENNGLRSLDLFLGIDNPGFYNFVDYINGKCGLSEAIIKDKKYNNGNPYYSQIKNRIRYSKVLRHYIKSKYKET